MCITVLPELSSSNCGAGENIRYNAKLCCQISEQVQNTGISLPALGKLCESGKRRKTLSRDRTHILA